MSTYRLEIVTGKKGLETFIWQFFPHLVPTSQSESFCIYACTSVKVFSEMQVQFLENWKEERIIVSYHCSEDGQTVVLKSFLTPVESAEISGYSEEYWRKRAWKGNVPGAIKSGKQWLLPRSFVEQHKKQSREIVDESRGSKQ